MLRLVVIAAAAVLSGCEAPAPWFPAGTAAEVAPGLSPDLADAYVYVVESPGQKQEILDRLGLAPMRETTVVSPAGRTYDVVDMGPYSVLFDVTSFAASEAATPHSPG